MSVFFAIVLSLLAIFLILLVLVQRGRGGGLAGALGGMGGSSAFGAKAGDVFTRITIITAAIWIGLSVAVFFWAEHRGDALGSASSAPAADAAMDLLPQRPPSERGAESTVGPAKAPESPATEPEAPADTNDAPPSEKE